MKHVKKLNPKPIDSGTNTTTPAGGDGSIPPVVATGPNPGCIPLGT
ncbi:MAG: hypothetical protein IPJ71_14375 [Bdellovibrionales bacterium]|jgi:hypothetical protein|nr:hypothetical protein [Bdellovibrionales bacterium]